MCYFHTGAHPDRPESVRPATEGDPSGASALPASNGASAAEVSRQSTSNLHSHAAAENGHSGLANGLPNLGPPKPGLHKLHLTQDATVLSLVP